MAIYSNSVKVIARSSPKSTLAVSAYINRNKVKDEETQKTYDFSNRKDLIYSEIMLPDNAPQAYRNRDKLWNAVEKIENGNGRTARTIQVALPIELNRQESIKVVQDFVRENFVKSGMCADFALHDKGDGNPHAHIMVTMRPLNAKGEWENKITKVYLCKNREGEERAFTAAEWQKVKSEWEKQLPYYRDGNPKNRYIYLTKYEAEHDERYSAYKRVKGKYDPKNDAVKENPLTEQWNDVETLKKWRVDWEVKVNAELERKNFRERIDHRSYKARGIEKKPTIHMGAIATQYERKGVETRKGNINRAVKADNARIEVLNRELAELEKLKKSIQQDTDITEIHEQTDEMKIALNKPATEQQLIQYREAIERLDKEMKAATSENHNEKQYYPIKNSEGKSEIKSYIEYHSEKFKRDKNRLMLEIEYKRISAKESRESLDKMQSEPPPRAAEQERVQPSKTTVQDHPQPPAAEQPQPEVNKASAGRQVQRPQSQQLKEESPPLLNVESIRRHMEQQEKAKSPKPVVNEASAGRQTSRQERPPQPAPTKQPPPEQTRQEQPQRQRQPSRPTAEQSAEQINGLKNEYIRLELVIERQQKAAESRREQTRQIKAQIEEIKQSTGYINQHNHRIEALSEDRARLGVFKGREKRAIEERVKELEQLIEQGERNLTQRHGITVSEAGDKLRELERQVSERETQTMGVWQQEIAQSKTPSATDKIRQEQGKIAEKYREAVKIAETHPERDKIIELVKQSASERMGKGSISERMAAAAEVELKKAPERVNKSRTRERGNRDDR